MAMSMQKLRRVLYFSSLIAFTLSPHNHSALDAIAKDKYDRSGFSVYFVRNPTLCWCSFTDISAETHQ